MKIFIWLFTENIFTAIISFEVLQMEKTKIRISDVARAAGVSNATVSRVLNNRSVVNGETYRKVINAMNTLGYSHSLGPEPSSGKKMVRDIILLCLPAINNPFYNEITIGVQNAAQRFGYKTLISTDPLDADGLPRLISVIKNNHVAGIITLTSLTPATLEKLCAVTQVVQCCEYCEGYNVPYVSIDDYQSTKAALYYLLSRGRKKIAFINGPLSYKYARHRKRAYLDFIAENHLPVQDDWIIHLSDVDFSMAVPAVTHLLSNQNLPTAVLTCSDVFASAVIKVAQKYQISVPRELMVVGFDNIYVSSMCEPSITTVNQPKQQLGYMACELLIERFSNPDVKPKQILLDTELVIRESTME